MSRFSGVWFPTALLLLLLLIVPGIVLLIVTLTGGEGALNGWLQRNFNLSYHILLPWWAALLVLLVPFLILLLYFLKMRRRPMQVPSTFLWKKSVQDLQVNSLFQWLRNNVLLLLQLLIVLFLIYAVMSIQLHGETTSGKHYILIIDSSASMGTADVSPSRLAVARQEALKVIDAHTDEDLGMVIEFNSRAMLRQGYTSDRSLLRSAVERIEQTQRPTRIDEALALADSLANPRRSTEDEAVRPANEDPAKARAYVPNEGLTAEVHLFTDGRFSDADQFAAGNLELNYHRIGLPGADLADNVGIVDCNASRDEQDPGKLHVFTRLLNFRNNSVNLKVELEWRIKGQEAFQLREVEVSIPARSVTPPNPEKEEPGSDKPGEGYANFELADVADNETVILRTRLLGITDSFDLDNQVWLVAGVVRKARVLIATSGNKILQAFFDGEEVRKVADVVYLKPEELKEDKYLRPARNGGYDLVVFDRCAPDRTEDMPLGNTFFIDAVPPPWERADFAAFKAIIRNPTSKHPLMRHLTGLDEIGFTDAFDFSPTEPPLPPRTELLLEVQGGKGVLLALRNRAFSDIVLTFPLVNDQEEWTSTWPLKPSFPLFLRNVLYQLGNVKDAAAEENTKPGEVKRLHPDTPVDHLDVFPPGASTPERVERSNQGDFLFQQTESLGVYRVAWDEGGRNFAVNLLDQEESNLEPREYVQIGNQSISAEQPIGKPRDLWKWAALAAVALLVIEWALYHQRIFH